MRSFAWALIILTSLAATFGSERGRVINVSTAQELMQTVRGPLGDVSIEIAPGTYNLTPSHESDSTNAGHDVSVGLRLTGHRVRLVGADADQVVIATGASRGVVFRDCVDCEMTGITVTGGVRTNDTNAAAVFAINSSARIANCIIRDNGGRLDPVSQEPHIDGVAARRQTMLTVEFCEFLHNAGDAISICDDAHAIVKNNWVGEMTQAGNTPVSAIRLGCEAQAVIERNLLQDYNSGISIGGRSNAEARYNIAEHMTNVGIGVSCNNQGRLRAIVESNVAFQCDASGVMAVCYKPNKEDLAGWVTRNMIVETGTRPSPLQYREPISLGNLPDDFIAEKNICYGNPPPVKATDPDVSREAFWRARRSWTRTYRNTAVGVNGRHKFYESAFLTRYGRWAD